MLAFNVDVIIARHVEPPPPKEKGSNTHTPPKKQRKRKGRKIEGHISL